MLQSDFILKDYYTLVSKPFSANDNVLFGYRSDLVFVTPEIFKCLCVLHNLKHLTVLVYAQVY